MSIKISARPVASTLTGSEIIGAIQDSADKRTTAQDIANLGTIPYKIYSADISQSGTSDPVATVWLNTLSGPLVWTRVAAGIYNGVLSGAFTSNKIGCLSSEFFYANNTRVIGNSDNNTIQITNKLSGTLVDGFHIYLEIKVYS